MAQPEANSVLWDDTAFYRTEGHMGKPQEAHPSSNHWDAEIPRLPHDLNQDGYGITRIFPQRTSVVYQIVL